MSEDADLHPNLTGLPGHPLLAALLQSTADAILVVDDTRQILLCNPAAEQLFGWSAAEAAGQPLSLLLPAVAPAELFAGGQCSSAARHKDGRSFTVQASISPVADPNAPLLVLALRQPTTAQKETDIHYQRLMEQASGPLFVHDFEGNLIDVNQPACESLGYTREELHKMNILDIDTDFDLASAQATWAKVIPGIPYTLNGKHRRKDGSVFPVEVRFGTSVWQGEQVYLGFARDISERKQAEEALRKNQRILQLFVEHAPAAIAMFDQNMVYLAASRRYLSDYNLGDQQVVGRSHYEIFPEIPERWKEIHRRCLAGATERCEADPFPRASGKLDWVRWEIRPWHDENNQIGGVILFSEVITQQQQAEEALRKSEHKFAILFNQSSMPAAFSRVPDLALVDVNQAWEELFGFSRAEVVGKTTLELGINRNPVLWKSGSNIVDRKQRVRGLEMVLHTKSGSPIHVIISSNPVEIDGEKYIITSIHDISDLKRAEAELRQYAERLKNLRQIDQGILAAVDAPETMTQAVLKNTGHLLACQTASIATFESTSDWASVITYHEKNGGTTLKRASLPDPAQPDWQNLQRGEVKAVKDTSQLAARPLVCQLFEDAAAGSLINVPLISQKGLVAVLHLGWERPRAWGDRELEIAREVASQITIAIEQVRLRREIEDYTHKLEERVAERTAQLEISNQELEAFAYSISHDLRAPLRGINGYAAILEEDYASRLDEDGRRMLNNIHSAANKMDQLITDILSLSRVSRAQINYTHIDMEHLTRSVYAEIASPEAQQRFNFSVHKLPAVSADKTLITQVWSNLISNAIKYTQTKDAPQIEISGREENGVCTYTIRDNGVGFNPQYKEKLFVLFQRLHHENEFEGTGVGLAIVQRIVQRHGGQVWAEGEPGRGAAFSFSLPRQKADSTPD